MTNSTNLLWQEPAWLKKASNWIDYQLSQQNIEHIATMLPQKVAIIAIEQFRVRHWSTVLRISTNVGNIYFKAVIPELAHEAALTEILSHSYPNCMPQILAISAENGWLLMGDGGVSLNEKLKTEDDIQHWLAILTIYAQLQKYSINQFDQLIEIGVYNRRLESLPSLYEELLTKTDILAIDNPEGISSLEYQILQDNTALFTSWCEQLAAFAIPETLHHGDLHDGNVFINDGRYIFFDWGDSSISHPFFSIQDIYANLNRRFGLEENSLWFERLKYCYLQSWLDYQTKENLEAAFEVAQKISPIPDILRWLPVLASMDETTRYKYITAVPKRLRQFLNKV